MANVVTFLGGTGTQTGTADPGVCTKAWWDAHVAGDFMTANGGEIVNAEACTVQDNLNGTYTLTQADKFANAEAGMFAYVGSAQSLFTIGYYEIYSATLDSITISVYSLNGSGDTGTNGEYVSLTIGGAGAVANGVALQDQLDHIAGFVDGTVNSIDILINKLAIGTTVELDFDTITGSATTDVVYAATNSTFAEDGTKQVITLTSDVAVGSVIEIPGDYIALRHIKVVGDGGSATPTNGIYATSAAFGTTLYKCQATGWAAQGIYLVGQRSVAIECVAVGPGTNGRCFRVGNLYCYLYRCVAIAGIRGYDCFANGISCHHCITISATGNGFICNFPINLEQCIVWDCTSNGSDLASSPNVIINSSINCIVTAFDGSASYSHSINNHTDSSVYAAGTLITDIGHVTGDPKFNRIVELTDLASTAGTNTVTSVTGGFTTDMAGGQLLLVHGGNFVGGSYTISSVTDTNTIVLAEDPTNGTNATGGTGGYYDFRLQTDSPLRGAGAGDYGNIGAYDDTDTPALANISTSDTFNDRDGTASAGGGGGASLSRIFGGM